MRLSTLPAFLWLFAATVGHAGGWCWDEAARVQRVSPLLLRAIAAEESSCNPSARGRTNPNGSVDHGPMQINSRWLNDRRFQKLGVQQADLYEPCKATYIGAWVLATCFKENGVTWAGVGCYNARTHSKRIEYAQRIYARVQRYNRTGKGICG